MVWRAIGLKRKFNTRPSVFIFLYSRFFSQLIVPVKAFTVAYYNVQKGVASAERIDEIITAEEVILEKPDALPINKFNDHIEYKKCLICLSTGACLNNINLRIEKRKMIALVGASGSGKSTMVDLLPRFYDCTEGGR